MSETRVLLDGLRFPEGPRWHDGKLWFSDMHAGCVMTIDLERPRRNILTSDDEPSGLGWLPDGRLLVVSMQERRAAAPSTERSRECTPTSAASRAFHCNDMVVDARAAPTSATSAST